MKYIVTFIMTIVFVFGITVEAKADVDALANGEITTETYKEGNVSVLKITASGSWTDTVITYQCNPIGGKVIVETAEMLFGMIPLSSSSYDETTVKEAVEENEDIRWLKNNPKTEVGRIWNDANMACVLATIFRR